MLRSASSKIAQSYLNLMYVPSASYLFEHNIEYIDKGCTPQTLKTFKSDFPFGGGGHTHTYGRRIDLPSI